MDGSYDESSSNYASMGSNQAVISKVAIRPFSVTQDTTEIEGKAQNLMGVSEKCIVIHTFLGEERLQVVLWENKVKMMEPTIENMEN